MENPCLILLPFPLTQPSKLHVASMSSSPIILITWSYHFLVSSTTTHNCLLIFSETNKNIMCPNTGFFQLHLLFGFLPLYTSLIIIQNMNSHNIWKSLPLSRLFWHVRCNQYGKSIILLRERERNSTLTDSLFPVSTLAQHLMHLYLVESLQTLVMSNTLFIQVQKLNLGGLGSLYRDM